MPKFLTNLYSISLDKQDVHIIIYSIIFSNFLLSIISKKSHK
jgi:hypothetical protein